MSRHVVFGTGQVGRLVVDRLVADGHDVVAVNRRGGRLPGAQVVAGDATDPAFTRTVCAGATAVVCCLNASSYAGWVEEFPPLQRGVLAGATAAGARLVVLDNLYAYGPPRGRRLVESMAAHPSSAKAATRAAMTDALLEAHRTGQVEVAVGRASDYVGPGTTASALGESVFGAALAGRPAQVMGDPDQPHSYSYTPDVAAGLVRLATSSPSAERGADPIWHLPVLETRTTRQLVAEVYRLAGHRPRLRAAGPVTLALVGLVVPGLREYRHTLYQFTAPWVVDDDRFRAAYAASATPLEEALASTLAWYRNRDRTAVPIR